MMRELKERLENCESYMRGCENALSNNLENWERKEYEAVLEDTAMEIESLKKRIKFLEKL